MKWLRLFYSIYWIQRISYCFSLFLSLKKALSCRQSNRMVIEVFQWNEIFLIVYRRIFLSRFLFRFHFYYCCKLFFFSRVSVINACLLACLMAFKATNCIMLWTSLASVNWLLNAAAEAATTFVVAGANGRYCFTQNIVCFCFVYNLFCMKTNTNKSHVHAVATTIFLVFVLPPTFFSIESRCCTRLFHSQLNEWWRCWAFLVKLRRVLNVFAYYFV